MRQFATYFLLELKKDIRMLPWFFGSILLLTVLVFSGTMAISQIFLKGQVFDAITVDMAVPDHETKVKLIADVLSNMESVKNICRFQYTTEEEAHIHIENGEADAAIIVGEHFYKDMENGKNTPAIILFPSYDIFENRMFRQLITDGVSLIQTTEAAVYAATDAGKIYGLKVSKKEMEDLIFFSYIEKAFFRGEIFQKHVISAAGEYGFLPYYGVSGLMICLLMCGLNFSFMYGKREEVIAEKLRIYGIGNIKSSAVKLLAMGLILWIIGMILLCLLQIAGKLLNFWEINLGSAMIGILPVSLSISALFHVVYTYGRRAGGVILFFLNIGMVLCSGAIIPVSYLPKTIQMAGAISPLSYWELHGAQLCFGIPEGKWFLLEGVITLGGIIIGALKGCYKWKKD
ncbi:MAG: ABC transporter permease [Lachnospiraceae bacterium]|nr:ABC transporter permease [Lachnospiraceae bacterium]